MKLEDMGIYKAYGKENKTEEKLKELYQFGKSLEWGNGDGVVNRLVKLDRVAA